MALLDDILDANRDYAERFDAAGLGAPPLRRVAVLTCMDARIEPLEALGLELGDAHVIRNAGALVTEDAVRSLVLSQRALGTDTVLVISHTKCGLIGLDEEALRGEIEAETGNTPPFSFGSVPDAPTAARTGARTLRDTVFLPRRTTVVGLVYDVDRGSLEVVDAPPA